MAGSEYAVMPVAVNAFLIGITSLALILRFVSRKKSEAGFWWDDWLVFAAWPFSLTIFICFIVAAFHGFGQHGGDPTFFLRILYFAEIWYTTALALTKLSVLCFYHRIFARTDRFTTTLYIMAVFVVVWWIAFVIASILQCIPIQGYWDRSIKAHCVQKFPFFMGQAVPNILVDFILLILPLKPIWQLQTKHVQKIALLLVFVLGYLNPLFSVMRIIWVIKRGHKTEADINYVFASPSMWSASEVAIAIVSCSIPSLYHLFRQVLGSSEKPLAGISNPDSDNDRSSFVTLTPVSTKDSKSRRMDNTKGAFTVRQQSRMGTAHKQMRQGSVTDLGGDETLLGTSDQIRVRREVAINIYQESELDW